MPPLHARREIGKAMRLGRRAGAERRRLAPQLVERPSPGLGLALGRLLACPPRLLGLVLGLAPLLGGEARAEAKKPTRPAQGGDGVAGVAAAGEIGDQPDHVALF